MTGAELVTTPSASRIPSGVEINDIGRLANNLAKSGYFRDARAGVQAFAKILFGRDLGLSASAAMTGIHIIEGKPEISANVQAQMVRTYIGPEGERYDYRVLEHSTEGCRIQFSRRRDGKWDLLGESQYTLEDAKRAGLAGKGNWQKHPRNMVFARAMSDGVAFHCPEVTNGIRTYHEGEIDVEGRIREQQAAANGSEAADVEVVDGDVVEDGTPPAPVVTAEPPAPTEDTISSRQRGLLHARCGELNLSDEVRHALVQCVTGQPHSDRIPRRLFGRAEADRREGILGILAAAKEKQASPEQLLQALRESYRDHDGPLGEDIGVLLEKIDDVVVPF